MWHLLHFHICSTVQKRDICSSGIGYITALRLRWKKLGVRWGMELPGGQADMNWILLCAWVKFLVTLQSLLQVFVKNELSSNRNSFKWRKWHHQNGLVADFQQSMPSDNDRSVLITCTVTQHGLYLAAWCEPAWLKVNGIAHSWAHCGDKRGSDTFHFDLLESLILLSHSGSIASPVKLLLLMMDQWGLFVIRYYTPPLPHLPFTL